MIAFRTMADSEWLDPEGIHAAYFKVVDLRGRSAVAIEVRSAGVNGKLMRLLFEKPTDRDPYCMLEFGPGAPTLPAYVSV